MRMAAPPPPPGPTPPRRPWWKNPLLLLLVLTPGIPEYLTGSSSATLVFVSPLSFVLFFALNAALYTPGALLIREAAVRWGKGWGSILLLGGAYGILEEGLTVHTFFETSGNPVGILGAYGHLWGVNWFWALGLSAFHAVYSIALPILLLGLVYPETKGRSIVGTRGLVVAASVLLADVLLLGVIVPSRPSALLAGLFLAIIGLLVWLAYRLPADFLSPRPGRTIGSLSTFGWLGAAWFPLWLLTGSFPPHTSVPAAVDGLILVAGEVAMLAFIVRRIRADDAERAALTFATGLIAVLVPWGILLVLATNPVAIGLDAMMLYALYRLRKPVWERSEPRLHPPPWGALRGSAVGGSPLGG
jgi:hypothetical protein